MSHMYSGVRNEELILAKTAVAAGTTTINSDVVDTALSERVEFTVLMGTITSGAATSVKLQQGTLADGSDMADLEGTSQTIADTQSDKIARLEVVRPRERYVRCVVSRATQNSVVNGILARKVGKRNKPITQHSSVIGSPNAEVAVSPPEGTA